MPRIGNIEVSNDVVQSLQRNAVAENAPPRPGIGAVLGAAAQGAFGQVRYGLPYQAEKLAGTLTPQDEAFYRRGLASTEAAAAAAAPATPGELLSGKVGFGRFLAENAVAMVPYAAGGVAGGIAGGIAGGAPGAVAGAIAGGIPQFSGSNVARAVQEQGGLSQQSAARALAAAPFQSATDLAIGRALPGVGKFLSPVLGEMAGRASSSFVRRTAMAMAEAGGSAAVAEAGQQLAERYAAGLPLSNADAAGEYVNAAATAFALGGVLGSAGGFRRTPAVAKPAAMVTEADMNAHVDEVLNGQAQAPLALPAPADIAVGADGVARVNPNGTVQLALPAPSTPTDFIVDAEGRTAPATPEGARDIVVDQNAPQPSAPPPPTAEELLARIQQATTPPEINAPNALAQEPVQAFEPAQTGPVLAPEASRPYAAEPIEDLHTALRVKNAPADIVELANREIQSRYEEANGTRPLTADKFETRLDEVKQGLRGGWVQKLDAANPTELVDKVYTRIFDDADTSANVSKLAQRLGILDENLEPTDLANRITAERDAAAMAPALPVEAAPAAPVEIAPPAPPAPAVQEAPPPAPVVQEAPPPAPVAQEAPPPAPVAQEAPPPPVVQQAPVAPREPEPGFADTWNKLKQEAGIERVSGGKDILATTPANMADAEAAVIGALATDSSSAEVSQVEKLARKMGLVMDDKSMDVTPKGREAFLRTPEGIRETASAAREQGFTDAHASLFDRGVRDETSGGQAPSLTDAGEMAAYQAGKVWARDYIENGEVRTAAQTAADRAANKAPVAKEGTRTQLSPEQVRQRSINRMIDAADLTGVRDSDVATLRRMARDGASVEEVGRALQQVQQGASLFKESDARVDTFRPARPERSTFRDTLKPEDRTPSKEAMRVESEMAVRAYDVRRQIEKALFAGKISEERAAKLQGLVDEGKVDQAERLTRLQEQAPTKLPPTPETVLERSDKSVFGDVDPAFEAAIADKDFHGALDHMIQNAPSTYMREIMQRVKLAADGLKKHGVELNLKLVKIGDQVPARLNNSGTRAVALSEINPPRATVYLKSSEIGGNAGVNYQLAAHEMLHAVTSSLIDWGSLKKNADTHIGKATADLIDLGNAIISHFNQRIADGAQLSQFEQDYYRRRTNSLANAHEILAWGLTNPDMQRYLSTIEYAPKKSVFSKLVDLVGKLLGLGTKQNTALAELMRVSERVLQPESGDIISTYKLHDPEGAPEGTIVSEARDGAAATPAAPDVNEATKSFADRMSQVVDKINPQDWAVKARRAVLGWLSHNQIDRMYGEAVPSVIEHSDAHRARVALRSRFDQMGDSSYHVFAQLEKELPKTAEALGRVMAAATEFQLDPARTWEEHTWVDKADKANAARLKRVYDQMMGMVRTLHADNGRGWEMFNHLRTLNEVQNIADMTMDLHRMVASDPELTMGVRDSRVNPADTFMTQDGLTTPKDIHGYWSGALDAQLAAARDFILRKRGEIPTMTKPDQETARRRLAPIEAKVNAVYEARASMAKAPYFHLGRFGDNFGAAVIRKLADGTVDLAAQRAVADALEKAGFTNAQISADNTKPRFMLRFDKVDQGVQFRKLAEDLMRQGHLDPNEEIKVGPRDRTDNYGVADGLPEYVAQYIANLENSPMYQIEPGMSAADRAAIAALKQEAIQIARDTWIERQPDNSISKMLTQRNTIPGYDPDMMRNFAQRWRVGSMSLANKASEPKFNRAYENMRAQYRDELITNRTDEQGNPIAPGNPYRTQDVMVELKLRDAKNPVNAAADTIDKVRSFAHSYYLGLSPAYNLINLSQLGVTALPELAKKHGYNASFHAMRRASVDAFKVLKAVAAEGARSGWQHWGDVSITDGVLKSSGLSAEQQQFLQHMMATGTIDIGSMARSLGQVADNNSVGSKLETYTRLASAAGLYTETFSRLVTALAARDLHGDFSPEARAYAAKAVSNSMFDYQSWNAARQLGKKGFLGPVTPLMTQFMSYSTQLTEKLYSEMHDAFGKVRPGESVEAAAARRAESRRFLLGHMAAVTSLAGTMGLPFATVFAGALEKVVAATQDPDDEPFDATAAYRDFLASVLGKDVGEVVARGLPRAFGADLSTRAGEQNLLPFSQFLTSSRSWKDSVADMAGQNVGAVPSMLISILDGGAAMAHGDVLGGMKAMIPTAFKGPTEAYRMSERGYVDTRGNKLPMSPTAAAYMWQLLGVTPAAKAEYTEAKNDQFVRKQHLQTRAGELHQNIMRALMSGDKESATKVISDAMEFDQNNPAFAVLPRVGSTINRSQQATAQAQALGAPIGVLPKDVAGQGLTRYANTN